jgi:hypothetical protein
VQPTRCFSITIAPKDEDEEEPTDIPIRLSFAFAHTPEYPDAPPLLKVSLVVPRCAEEGRQLGSSRRVHDCSALVLPLLLPQRAVLSTSCGVCGGHSIGTAPPRR